MSSLAARRSVRCPALRTKLQQMSLPLQPLVQFDTGLAHPAFPRSMLQFMLLTDDQLESLASFYHQRSPHALHFCYPCPISWPRHGLSLEDKRRKFGKFIGLRGCDTPVEGTFHNAFNRCPGNCPDPAQIAPGSAYYCYDCGIKRVQAILAGEMPLPSVATASAAPTPPVASVLAPARHVPTRSLQRKRKDRDGNDDGDSDSRKTRRPATYALRLKHMAHVARTSIPSPIASPISSPTTVSIGSGDAGDAGDAGAGASAFFRTRPSPAHEAVPASSSPCMSTMPNSVEEILEHARRARLQVDSDDAIARRKVGHY